jgi:hypothetical protein
MHGRRQLVETVSSAEKEGLLQVLQCCCKTGGVAIIPAAWVPRLLILHGWLEAGVHILEEAAQQNMQHAFNDAHIEHWCPMCRNSTRLLMHSKDFHRKHDTQRATEKSLIEICMNSTAPADGIIVETTRVVCCMLLQRQLPKLAANLVATLSNLDSDQLSWHASDALCSLHPVYPGSDLALLLHGRVL